jgi:hypothetical protein
MEGLSVVGLGAYAAYQKKLAAALLRNFFATCWSMEEVVPALRPALRT